MRKFLITLVGSLLLLVYSTANLAISQQYYRPTQENDRLWRIALATRPNSDISPQQMMVALWKNNPSAFNKNNMNGLYTGVRLSIPEYNDVVKVSPTSAEQIVAHHNQLWREGRVLLPEPVTADMNETTDINNTTIQPQIYTIANRVHSSVPHRGIAHRASHPTSHTASAPRGASISAQKIKLSQLQAHLELLSQQINAFIFDTHNQIANLDQDQTVVRKQLLAMAETVQALTDQVDQQQATLATLSHSNRAEHFAWQQQIQSYVMIGGALIALLFVLLLITWIKMIKTSGVDQYLPPEDEIQPQPQTNEDDKELEDEYDFINSSEGIGAKLDLARAYIDMDDMVGAKQILQEVIKNGDSTHRTEAQQLLAHIDVPEPV